MTVDVDVLDCCFDGAHEEQFLVFVDSSLAQLSDCHSPHVCTCEVFVPENEFYMVRLVSFFIGLNILASRLRMQ